MQIELSLVTRERLRDGLIVASPSGGKDSTRGEGGPIDEVVGLAHTHRGKPLLAEPEPAGCVRWGLCEQSPASSAPDLSDPAPTPPPRRCIGHDHLVSLGAPAATIAAWVAAGILKPTEHDGFYERTSEIDERMVAQRIVGRGHLLALGATNSLIGRWLRRGILKRTAERGFYSIAQVAFDGLRAGARSAGVPAEPLQPVEEAPSPVAATKPDNLRIGPCTISLARAFVARHHRHLGPPVSGLFAVSVTRGAELVGVAIVGRPVARQLQDGSTAEVTRVCTRGERNACSMLLAACRRGAVALGYRRLVTYTLKSEPGTSLKAAGWRQVAEVRGRSWDCSARRRTSARSPDKRRWEAPLSHTKEIQDVAA